MAKSSGSKPRTCIVDLDGPNFISDQHFHPSISVSSFMMQFDRLNPAPPPPGKKRKRKSHQKDICYEFLQRPNIGRREMHYYMMDVCVYDVNKQEIVLHICNSMPPEVRRNLSQPGRCALGLQAKILGFNKETVYDRTKPQSVFYDRLKNTLKDYGVIIHKGGQIERAFVEEALGNDNRSHALIDLNDFDVCRVAMIPNLEHYEAMIPTCNDCLVHSNKSKEHCPRYETSVFAEYIRESGVLDKIYSSLQAAVDEKALQEGEKILEMTSSNARREEKDMTVVHEADGAPAAKQRRVCFTDDVALQPSTSNQKYSDSAPK